MTQQKSRTKIQKKVKFDEVNESECLGTNDGSNIEHSQNISGCDSSFANTYKASKNESLLQLKDHKV